MGRKTGWVVAVLLSASSLAEANWPLCVVDDMLNGADGIWLTHEPGLVDEPWLHLAVTEPTPDLPADQSGEMTCGP